MILRLLLATLALSHSWAASLDSEKDHDRVLHGKPLSDREHHDDLDHDYDHEAFLGLQSWKSEVVSSFWFLGDEAHEFDDLSPEESQRRLAIIVDKIDEDGDGYVSVDELRNWIKFTQNRQYDRSASVRWFQYDILRYVSEDVEKQWSLHKPDTKETINWSEYRDGVYGFLDEEDGHEEEHGFSYK